MVSDATGLPAYFVPGRKRSDGRGIDPATTRNVKWTARLGAHVYGNATVAGGSVFVGTDDTLLQGDSRFRRTRGGLVQCLDGDTGDLQWKLVVPVRKELPEGTHFTHQWLGTCSAPTVDQGRVYVVTSACEVVCLDGNGMVDGNDGPFTGEAAYMVPKGQPPVELTAEDGDIIWRFDMIDEVAVRPHDAASCSPLVHADMLYVTTSNGVDAPHKKVVNPDAPSMIVLDKQTGRLLAVDGQQIGSRLYHAQWSSPSLGTVGDRTLVFLGGGDGVCYAFEALSEKPEQTEKPPSLKLVWSYDCNPEEYKYRDGKLIPYYDGDKRKKRGNKNDGQYIGPSQIIATPVFHQGRVYVPIGQDPAHGRGKGMLHCIDASGEGDITQSGRVWSYAGIERTMASVAVADGLVYCPDTAGHVHCLDAETGECCWIHDTKAEIWGSPLVVDGKVYQGSKSGLWVFKAGRKASAPGHIELGAPMYTSPIVARGVLYVASQRYLWAVASSTGEPPAASSR
jgi:outer membrane protein assembly factor BamB